MNHSTGPDAPQRRFSIDTLLRRQDATRTQKFPALPPRLGEGEPLGEYRIVRSIRCGSNSGVFEAESPGSGRPVAVKVLSSHLAVHPTAVRRFRMEADLAERVSHPSIVPVYGRGSDRGYHFYTMRLESGTTLEDLTPDSVFHSDEDFYVRVSSRFASLARALHRVHASQIVHRDVKPSNILIDVDDHYVLADFGSALDAADRNRELENCSGGTTRYMSPEQLKPGADPYDRAGDIYSLGITLYELCTGTSPYPHCRDEELARLKLTRVPPPPRRLNHHIPLGLEAIIRQAIETRTELRYRAAEELARDLDRFVGRKKASGR